MENLWKLNIVKKTSIDETAFKTFSSNLVFNESLKINVVFCHKLGNVLNR